MVVLHLSLIEWNGSLRTDALHHNLCTQQCARCLVAVPLEGADEVFAVRASLFLMCRVASSLPRDAPHPKRICCGPALPLGRNSVRTCKLGLGVLETPYVRKMLVHKAVLRSRQGGFIYVTVFVHATYSTTHGTSSAPTNPSLSGFSSALHVARR